MYFKVYCVWCLFVEFCIFWRMRSKIVYYFNCIGWSLKMGRLLLGSFRDLRVGYVILEFYYLLSVWLLVEWIWFIDKVGLINYLVCFGILFNFMVYLNLVCKDFWLVLVLKLINLLFLILLRGFLKFFILMFYCWRFLVFNFLWFRILIYYLLFNWKFKFW